MVDIYEIGFDISEDGEDESILVVAKRNNGKLECINTIRGNEAKELNERLTNNK
jgi:hypothetical protein